MTMMMKKKRKGRRLLLFTGKTSGLSRKSAPMTFAELKAIYDTPLFELISRSRAVYLDHWRGDEMQLCTLLSIKTGGCSEDCGYCAQSARYSTGVQAERLMTTEAIMETARRAKENGSTR